MRRQQIQEAAKEIFLLKGFNSTTMEDIAKKAELSPAFIYFTIAHIDCDAEGVEDFWQGVVEAYRRY